MWIVVDIFSRHFISSFVNDNVVVVPPPSPQASELMFKQAFD